MDRDRQIALIESAEERTKGYFRQWLEVPGFRAALHCYDRDQDGDDEPHRAGSAQ